MYTESSSESISNDESDLFTGVIVRSPKQCLTFWYHMYGSDIKTLKVFQLNREHTIELWSKSYNQGNKWYFQSLALKDIGPYEINFKAIRGDGDKSDIAIDDILITNTVCKKDIDCNFETGQCGWKTEETAYKWTNWHDRTPSDYTGPDVDHTLGTSAGGYIYLEASRISIGRMSNLTSETVYPDGDACFTFWYYMYGRDMGTLNVYFDFENVSTIAWSKSRNIAKRWLLASLNMYSSKPYKIVFEGIRGEDSKGDIALDDIALLPGLCEEAFSLDCNFEGGQCYWLTDPVPPYIWEILAGSTPSDGTGPDNDHTTELSDGHYIYLEGSDVEEGMKSELTSKTISTYGDTCFTFWYHMYGKDIGTLNVYTESGNITKRQWSRYGNQGNAWNFANFDISETEPFKIIFEGIRGDNFMSDIALDDTLLRRRSCSSFIVDCDFETGNGLWSTDPDSAYIWKIESGPTISFATGPYNDHTTGSANGHYIYLEGSHVEEGMMSELTSKTISTDGDTCFTFWYHMYGKDIGTLNVFIESGNIIRRQWSRYGNQGNAWKFAYFTISKSGSFRIIFEGTRGDDSKSDIALDDISLLQRSCSGLIKTSQTCHNIDESISLHECSKYYLQLNETSLVFDREVDRCSTVYQDVQTSITTLCKEINNSDICTFNLSKLIMEDQRCFQSNWLSVQYKCEVSDTSVTSESATGLVVGLVIGGLLLACVIIFIVALVRRHTFKSNPREKIRNNLGGNDYIGGQDIALPQTVNQSSHLQNDGMYEQSRNNFDHDYDSIHPNAQVNNVQQKYTNISAANGFVNKERVQAPTNAVRRDKTFADDHKSNDDEYAIVYPIAETSFNEISDDETGTSHSNVVLDPNDTGINRTTFYNTPIGYEFAKPVRDTGNKIADDDQYDLSNEGTYDHSGDNRHIELKDNIYNHAMDTVYDSGSHKRNNEGREDTYDHFIGQKN
ncbi:MAM and LDL-receptor class A domain-containing protein 1-like [Mytilus californianus]|uniref:MAM and LDL-receptor class A domain-containing protein 1-like n=1 Tax=Mytilus californianus TaxID=6549 RepID=UPI0022467DE9|nr:MAM and LDL-receptor class A domain-containing protein 1-like [Mytilus californianus]